MQSHHQHHGGPPQHHQQTYTPNTSYHHSALMMMKRKPSVRKCIDATAPLLTLLNQRKFHPHLTGDATTSLNPHSRYKRYLLPPQRASHASLAHCMATKFCRTSINKQRCPIYCVTWTPEGRRLITGNHVGEFTLWNGTAFNFETILQAHDDAIQAMKWSHNGQWMITADQSGRIKYWQPSMTNVQLLQGHREAVRCLTFAPSDRKFVSCSDDATIKIWDFELGREEQVLTGHGWDVKTVDYHPTKSLLASGSKDNLVKLWDPRASSSSAAACVRTLHGHKNTVLSVSWNQNGHWLLTTSRDQLVKLYDIRKMKEFATLKGHTREVTSAAWHPVHERLFCSGSYDGSLLYWVVGFDSPQAKVRGAHEGSVWDIQWHPLGHVVATASNDHTTKFWCRNRPGDPMDDKYNSGENITTMTDASGGSVGAFRVAGSSSSLSSGKTSGAQMNASLSNHQDQGLDSEEMQLPGMMKSEEFTMTSTSTSSVAQQMMNPTGFASLSSSSAVIAASAHHLASASSFSNKRPPPDSYTCNRCGTKGGTKGHWIDDCPTKQQGASSNMPSGGVPPPGYICKRCSIPGHYIGDCPTIAGQANTGTGLNVPPPGYICKKCSIPGHYVSDCPGGLGQHLGGNQQLASGPAPGNTPPPGYLCKKCSIPGHYLSDCPTSQQTQQVNTGTGANVPPSNYVCKKCNVPGHYVSDCPQNSAGGHVKSNIPPDDYVCHRCQQRGHWRQHCPSLGGSGMSSHHQPPPGNMNTGGHYGPGPTTGGGVLGPPPPSHRPPQPADPRAAKKSRWN